MSKSGRTNGGNNDDDSEIVGGGKVGFLAATSERCMKRHSMICWVSLIVLFVLLISAMITIIIVFVTSGAKVVEPGPVVTSPILPIYHHFATKTSYNNSFDESTYAIHMNTTLPQREGCQPIFLSLLGRHGSRYPTLKSFNKAMKLHKKLRKGITNSRFDALKNWKSSSFDYRDLGNLNWQGKMEWFEIGRRFVKRFPQIVENPKDARIRMIASKKFRSIRSGIAFIEGLSQGSPSPTEMTMQFNVREKQMRFYDYNATYVKFKETAPVQQPQEDFEEGPQMLEMAKTASLRLTDGKDDGLLDGGDLYRFLKICGYEVMHRNSSPWCDVFYKEEEILAPEFLADMGKYWEAAAYPINYLMMCPLFRIMLDEMQNATTQSSPVAALRFGHSDTVGPLITLLNISNEGQNLTTTTYDQMQNRKYRASKLFPMAANTAFVLHRCENEVMVVTMINEVPTKMTFCPDLFCPWRTFLGYFENKCRYDW